MPTRSIASHIDHTLLKADAAEADIRRICDEARRFRFAAVCVNPLYVPLCAGLLKGSGVRVCTVIGFPLGAQSALAKAFEARDAVAAGADELDMVMSIGALKSGLAGEVLEDIRSVRAACPGRVLKVIIEAALLTGREKTKACRLALRGGADFVKTSTGFGPHGARSEDVRLMRRTVGPNMGVKAAGGISTLEDALAMLEAGANRIGSSHSVAIVSGAGLRGSR